MFRRGGINYWATVYRRAEATVRGRCRGVKRGVEWQERVLSLATEITSLSSSTEKRPE